VVITVINDVHKNISTAHRAAFISWPGTDKIKLNNFVERSR